MMETSLFEEPEMKVLRLNEDTDVIRTSLSDEEHDVWQDDFFD